VRDVPAREALADAVKEFGERRSAPNRIGVGGGAREQRQTESSVERVEEALTWTPSSLSVQVARVCRSSASGLGRQVAATSVGVR
jgi:hypothetical protein